jgi:hypothetical protein
MNPLGIFLILLIIYFLTDVLRSNKKLNPLGGKFRRAYRVLIELIVVFIAMWLYIHATWA